MSGRTKLPELLAPAGSRRAFLGALNAGADAIYLGGEKFGARAYAENFTQDDIILSIRQAHLFGKKVYLTLNVLTRESELEETAEFAGNLYREGLDGVIVQDTGVLSLLRDRCPGLQLHASTQMSVTGPESVRYLKKLGVCRVVPARELSLSEIRAMKEEEPVDIESFIHGAMCYCYSGRCLLSSFLGGRSGNRGRCAGTCRLPYRIIGSDGKEIPVSKGRDMPYPLSMRDMCVLEILPDLIDAGIDSFKIEGRMKSPHYAAGVTALYRKYIDLYVKWDAEGRNKPWRVSAEDMKKLRSLYLRSDLSTGYYYKKNGRDFLTIGKPGYAGTDEHLLEQIEQKYLRENIKRKVNGKAFFEPGKEAVLTVWTAENLPGEEGGIRAKASGEIVQPAQKRPMSADEIGKRLRKTGDSYFTFDKLQVEVRGDIFLPVAALNALRRQALDGLQENILRAVSPVRRDSAAGRTVRDEQGAEGRGSVSVEKNGERPAVWAQVTTLQQLRAAQRAGVDHIIVEETPQIMKALTKEERALCLAALPHVYRRSSLKAVKGLLEGGFKGVLARNQEELDILQQQEYRGLILADGSLYQWNSRARDLLLERCDMANLGWELSAGDMMPLIRGAENRQLMHVYGRIPMMVTAGCVRKTAGICSHTEQDLLALEDRKGMRFPVRCVCGHCSNVIYNSLPLSLHSFVMKRDAAVTAVSGWICSFTTESGRETEEILRWYANGGSAEEAKRIFRDFTTGHYRKSAI